MSNSLMNTVMNTCMQIGPGVEEGIRYFICKTNGRTGAKTASAVLTDGRMIQRTITSTGVLIDSICQVPTNYNRNAIIGDLLNQGWTQQKVADLLQISQATVSRIARRK